ncbi:hypothetical protein BJP40_12475 [Streptomyces sp. CC53]|uniref:hypothetical protein n=1 Tax=unclassified Streptomyces TaxID=2593676 RepID=UPI0008DDC97D|nr:MULTISPECIES: hypothetical protein [unclassified Streptomyces]OII59850.1 hypothetical protein BJP40_12475 [Streptomyces sp. CC53]
MEAAITILALLIVALVALGVYATVKVVRATKRGVDRTIDHARRAVEDTALRAKSFGQTGVAGELAQLRLSLRTSMRATQDALQAGAAEDASLKESLDVFRRLSVHGRELDDELRRMEQEPDRARVAACLEELKERTRKVTESADALRWAARDRARRFAQDDLDALSQQIDMEAGALRHWAESAPPPAAPGASTGPARGPAGRDLPDASWPQASADTASDQVWPTEAEHDRTVVDTPPGADEQPAAGGQREPGGDRPAISARDPRLDLGYPWEKSPRRETST